MLRRVLAAASVAAALLAGSGPVFAADPKPLTFEALRGLVTVREPQISPDGGRVVYVRSAGNYKT
ncbi:MAG: hypothetical protein QOJ39_3736, partial [Candidatus Eremiobacteraeota bacterium]|nr:hypothetical protein [Candidatus Eremiobacteraeota bacterium]